MHTPLGMAPTSKAVRLDPELWEACKAEAVTKLGKFSARAMQQAVVLYKKRGGRYSGQKSEQNALVKWTKKEKTTRRAAEAG